MRKKHYSLPQARPVRNLRQSQLSANPDVAWTADVTWTEGRMQGKRISAGMAPAVDARQWQTAGMRSSLSSRPPPGARLAPRSLAAAVYRHRAARADCKLAVPPC